MLEEQYCFWSVNHGIVWVGKDLKDLLVPKEDQNQSFLLKKPMCIENFLNLVDSVKLFFIRYKLNNSFEPPEETLFYLIYISCTTAP